MSDRLDVHPRGTLLFLQWRFLPSWPFIHQSPLHLQVNAHLSVLLHQGQVSADSLQGLSKAMTCIATTSCRLRSLYVSLCG